MIVDGWYTNGYYNYFGKLWAAMFECAPVMVVHSIALRNTASSICPRRRFYQFHCPEDTQCMEDAQSFIDVADTHEFYTCGVLARHLGIFCYMKSGRRRLVLCQNHGNVRFDDVDVIRMEEKSLGKIQNVFICPQNLYLLILIFILAINCAHQPFMTRVYLGSNYGKDHGDRKTRRRLLLEARF